MTDDASLLRRFVQQHANDAFAELVRRHLNLVYFAALRQTDGDTHRAEDAAQTTFTFLAQKAGSLLAHPNLAGWLHTVACHHARDLNRAEHRRLHREQAAHVMHELTSAEANDETWTQVRPIIDDALQDLTPDDREAVLLRYFENRPFAEIGAELQLGENAARMRVSRALGQLETALARRGVKSTSAALATVLAIPAAMAAPTGLATQFSATALIGGGATTFIIFKIMTSAKLITTASSLAALLALGTALYQHKELQKAQIESASLREQQNGLSSQLANLKERLASEKKRADDADADTAKLLAAYSASRDQATATKPMNQEQTDVQSRYQKGRSLADSGHYAEALTEFLWCYDSGMKSSPEFAGVRLSFLLSDLNKLGAKYPPALAALRERRDQAEQHLLANASDRTSAGEFAAINKTLGEEQKNIELFDKLPANDARRRGLLVRVYDQLIEQQRYTDAAAAKPYSALVSAFSRNVEMLGQMPNEQKSVYRQYVSRTTAKNIEALAGAGELDNAGKLIGRLLEFDNSAENRATIQTHLTRAGHPELLKAQ